MRRMLRQLGPLVLAVAGCAPSSPLPTTTEPVPIGEVRTLAGSVPGGMEAPPWNPRAAASGEVRADDARPSPQLFYQLNIYQLSAPVGAISTNDEFWKPVDETMVSPATYDVLWKNGVRIGAAPVSQLDHIRDYLDNPIGSSTVVAGFDASEIELSATRDVPQQNLFYLDQQNRLHARSYDRCDNVLFLSFFTPPRKPGHVRITLSPAVLTYRKRLEFAELRGGEDREIRYRAPRTIYDLNIRVDLPMDHFLVVAPSPESMWETSVGRLFFIDERPSERLERVFVIVARAAAMPTPTPPGQ
jgi:hypothetical protein